MKRKRDSERDARQEEFRRLLERAKDELIASGETVLTPKEWEKPSSERLRLIVERREAERAARRRAQGSSEQP